LAKKVGKNKNIKKSFKIRLFGHNIDLFADFHQKIQKKICQVLMG